MENKLALSKTDYISYAYALTIFAGGLMGYVKARSLPSLGKLINYNLNQILYYICLF